MIFKYKSFLEVYMSKKNIAIITGASSGLGKEFVKLLVKRNDLDHIWCIARNKEKLQELVTEYGSIINPISMDLSNLENIKTLPKILSQENVKISFLINN